MNFQIVDEFYQNVDKYVHNGILYFQTLLCMVYFAKFKRNVYMAKYSFLLVILVFLSCTDENMTFKIGGDYVDVKTNIRYIDTLTVHSFTVMMDSVKTSGLQSPVMLVGKYTDPEFGNISSKSYFRVSLPASKILPKDAVFDSLQLILLYNDYSAGDTTKEYTINVHRLSQTIKLNDDSYLYNTSRFTYFDELYGTETFTPRPNTNDTLWIRMNDSFGNELFDLFMDKDDKVSDNLSFLNYFRGLVISGDDTDDAILGFKFPTSSETNVKFPTMRLYYHYYDFENVSAYLDFIVSSSDYDLQFNQIQLSEPVVNFPAEQRNKLSSALSNNRSYLLAGVGLMTRFEIPYLKNLFEFHENLQIVKAELQIEPIRNTYKTIALPEEVSLYISDDLNRFGSAIIDQSNQVQIGDLEIDELYQEDTRYTFDITYYCEGKLKEESSDGSTPALLFTVTPENLYSTLDRLIIGNQRNAQNQVTLKVYYMYYE